MGFQLQCCLSLALLLAVQVFDYEY